MTETNEHVSENQGLVEPEGVNAAPAAVDAAPPDGDVRSGGEPERSGQMDGVASRDEIVGPPDQDHDGPGQELAIGEGSPS